MFWSLALLFLTILFFCCYWIKNFGYWKMRGVPHPPYSFIFGHFKDVVFFKRSPGQIAEEIYKHYEDLSYVGIYKMRTPAVIIRNAEFAKTVLIKEFESFHDNDIQLAEDADIFGKNIFVLKGDRWQYFRKILMPYFTPKKMKMILPIISDNAKKMVKYIENLKLTQEIDCRKMIMYFTIENVSTSGFGYEAHAFEENQKDIVTIMVKSLAEFTDALSFLSILTVIMPNVADFLKVRITPKKAEDHFRKIILDVIKYRKENKIIREDYMNLLIDAQNKSKLTTDDVIAQSFVMYLDGTETSSNAMTFILYELSINPEVQEKLKKEIDDVIKEDELTYEMLQDMKYLDCVIKESLRVHPPAIALQKRCTRQFKLPPLKKDGTGPIVTIEPGTAVIIPIKCLHLDPTNYENSEQFIPERFLDGTKSIWIPFGDGPRMCLGMRFALLQIKVGLIHLVKNFRIKLNSKTVTPLQMGPNPFVDIVKDGIWLNLEKRNFDKK